MERADNPGRLRGKSLLKTGLFAGGGLLVAAVFLVTNQTIQRLSDQVSTTSGVLARLCADASIPATGNPQLQRILEDVTAQITFPIVITDTTGLPRAWKGVGVPADAVPTETLDSLAMGLPISPVHSAAVQRVSARVPDLDRRHRPIPLKQPNTTLAIGLFHYGEPAVLDRLRWMPYLAVGGTGLLLLLGMSGLAGIRAAEKRTIWVGMAKETAHQLGTPLSSLMGWVELLRAHVDAAPPGGNATVPREELGETLDDMERDIERLSRVAQRFSQIGSSPQLHLQDVTPLVREAVQYVRRRLPQRLGDIELRERYEEAPPINLNRELFEWAVENLLMNALDALDKRPGVIEVAVERRAETEEVEITVSDNGRGMTREQQHRAFETGYSTKRRGWGLGLALARRVVEEYHAGRIEIRSSAPGQGTVMVIRFPT
jgi:NtrC-family two-component system sensor histidine kinase KinB